ncbi:MAG TPA: DNA polymerase/3'-5' exonuclease PolX [Solirubrobacteraceae bacterium]|nr:DNA polymerase/3'-5' exonuclease PolX [Solirubrobacteraceae bacterium]
MSSATDPAASVDPSNSAIAAALDELGDLYELDGAIVHRVVAYRNAAKAIRDAPVSVAALARAGRATELAGVGRTLEQKILDLINTGSIPAAEKLRAKFPPGLIDITRLPGLGPKRARFLFDELGIDGLAALREAAQQQRLRQLRGFGPRFEEGVLAALAAGAGAKPAPRVLLPRALGIAEQIEGGLNAAAPGVADRLEVAGSARRMADSVKDLDLAAASEQPERLVAALGELELIESSQVAAPGGARGAARRAPAGARARTHTGLPVELRVVTPDRFGNLLQHLTGSGEHNLALREAAARRGLHVSEYGVLDDATGQEHHHAREEDVYALLGMEWIEPELRENRGELEAAARSSAGEPGLPTLVGLADIRGDLHCHTIASDGRNTIEEMARAALERGYEYLAITDHSASHGFGNDVQPDELRRQIARVREINSRLDGIEVLAGSEVNILPDGSLDYEDQLLAELDWVIASVHTAFGMSEREMTDRIVAAMEHPLVDAIGHPTGRKIERRPPYAVSIDELIDAAARTGTMLEINGNPDRRDLSDIHARAAAQAGVRVLIDSDAHGVNTLGMIRWALATARRAWLTPAQAANTLPWEHFATLRKHAVRAGP